MGKALTGAANSGNLNGLRIVVAGDQGTGKSSLIVKAATDYFTADVPPVLPPTIFRSNFGPVTIIDTSSSSRNRSELVDELRRADVVVLTFACDQPATLDRLGTFWLPELRRWKVKVPVILAGCKVDLRDEMQQMILEQAMVQIMQQFQEIETGIECSASTHVQVHDVFICAQNAVLYPLGPLFDQEKQCLKDRCVRALRRIFVLCDHDKDGVLCDAELNNFQVRCFNAALLPSEISHLKKLVQEKLKEGVNEHGLTFTGFLFLHAFYIERGRLENIWTVLRTFGYDDNIKIREDLIPIPIKQAPDQNMELTTEALGFLKGIFSLFDMDGDGLLHPDELADLFSNAPESPWIEAPYKDAAEKTALGGFSLDGFLSEWALLTLLHPVSSLENLIYLGYPGDLPSALRITRKRRLDCKRQQSDRYVFQCFVFGPKGAGKSGLLNALLGRPFSDNNNPTIDERYAVNVVNQSGGSKKTLVLREIPEDGVMGLLSNRHSLAACDIALFVYDSSKESSWKRAAELLVEVASHGEKSGYGMPCLVVAAKDDLDPYPNAIHETMKLTQDMGIEPPIPISAKLGDADAVFQRIIAAAEHPHLSIPETEAGRSRKEAKRRIVNRTVTGVSVGVAVAFVGLAAYSVYASRKNA